MRTTIRAVLGFLVLAFAAPPFGHAQDAVRIGYISLEDDPRYPEDSAYAGIVFRTVGRPLPGAELGIQDAQTLGRVIGRTFELKTAALRSAEDLAPRVSGWVRDGISFVIADLPASELIALSDAVAGEPVMLMNVSARDDDLRASQCRSNILHVIPSEGMLTDALAQQLTFLGWKRIMILRGHRPRDKAEAAAMRSSAAKFGLEVVAEKPFSLSRNPAARERNNIRLMTRGVDADVVFVADASGEFARYVPYQTAYPTPVVGDAGLMPVAWHWTWHRNGAPQVQHRFEELAPPRRMNSEAWAAWVAVKAVTQAVLRAPSARFGDLSDYLLGDALRLDGSKGNPMSFRAWDHQLRQPILLATADAVIATAPVEGFLHRTNDLDTLGFDAPESRCAMR